MKIHLFLAILLTFGFYNVFSQVDLTYYLPAGTEYNTNIPTPKSVIGHEVGEWHVSHDRLVNYMKTLAEASDRISLIEYAESYESRPLVILAITSKDNQSRLEEIKKQHVQLTDHTASGALNIASMPGVAYFGYSVHGNEPSGSNASMLVAYYLAAAQGKEIEDILNNTVILLDPSFNPDGLHRFASWVNSRKSYVETSDTYNMEQNEPWPRGRTNHYWFDLNRDWLPVQHPESQGRIKIFHEWKPNLLTDHHEMGTNSTFFFQPGIPSRNNPLTPENTYKLTSKMGEYHAEALDNIGSLYYTNESYDDYYYGKGSSYPDINGAVGILFEQASSRGHAQESIHGVLRFPFTIKNQFTTSLSSLRAIYEMREDFLKHQRDFYQNAAKEASQDDQKAIVFSSKDKIRAKGLADLIHRHDVDIYQTASRTTIKGKNYEPGEAYIIPLAQKQYRLIKAMFEKRTTFQDSLFYDVSTWTLPLAFGLDYQTLEGRAFSKNMLGNKYDRKEVSEGEVVGGKSEYAYAFEWYNYNSPKVLYHLLKKNYKVKMATEPFTHESGKLMARGSILIPVVMQEKSSDYIYQELLSLAKANDITFYAYKSGLDYQTVSLGSPSFVNISKPKVLLLVDGGVSPYEAGEVWHLFDQRYKIDLSLVPIDIFNRADIDKYNTIVMVNGRYNEISKQAGNKLKQWVKEGGTIVASKSALSYLHGVGLGNFKMKKQSKIDSTLAKKYGNISEWRGAQQIGGAIFEVKIDNTSPLFYGYDDPVIPVFRNSELFMEKSANPFANPAVYTDNPLLSGYISEENLELLRNTSAVGYSTHGRGRVIGFTDNMNFRAFWYGTNKAFINAIFFGNQLSSAGAR
ncbi:MAG: M14 family metallopeptidase [Fulvivirga sp.]|nr:M14 family metallopeptidase [Fulvivirga sp.]